MPRYRVLRDFGSHLGNHYVGEVLNLPDGDLPRGFAGFVERVAEPQRPVTPSAGAPTVPFPSIKDVRPASERADDVPPEAGTSRPAQSASDRVPSDADDADLPESAERPTPAEQARAGYPDKMIRNSGGRRR